MSLYGLIGFPLGHSFSKKYFEEKFDREKLPHRYTLFELEKIGGLPALLRQNPTLAGLNVTIPYKQTVIPWLHHLNPEAEKIGAVNTIKITGGKLTGYNTDYIGFRDSLLAFLPANFGGKALILGTGGSAQAVKAALTELQIGFASVSRQPGKAEFSLANLSESALSDHKLIINTTPLGMHPHTGTYPPIPYKAVTPEHYLFDLVYNPDKTRFLELGEQQGAQIKNGLGMLYLQAEAAWQIWQH